MQVITIRDCSRFTNSSKDFQVLVSTACKCYLIQQRVYWVLSAYALNGITNVLTRGRFYWRIWCDDRNRGTQGERSEGAMLLTLSTKEMPWDKRYKDRGSRTWKRQEKRFSPRTWRGSMSGPPALNPFWTSDFQHCKRINLCSLKPLHLC